MAEDPVSHGEHSVPERMPEELVVQCSSSCKLGPVVVLFEFKESVILNFDGVFACVV